MRILQGIDIVSVARMKAVILRHGRPFLKKIFTARERSYCDGKRRKYEHYAARFAAKEAALKAMEIVRRDAYYRFSEIEVLRSPSGKPSLSIAPASRRHFGLPRRFKFELSLSHERDYAVASVLLILP